MSYYSSGLPYLEDIGHEEERTAQCMNCEVEEEVAGTHYLDSETFRWQCERCGYLNDTPAPAEDYPDPDYLYDQMREEQLFGHL